MRDVATGPQVVRFGVFELDLRAGELRKKGLRLRLQEQPLQVLALLLQQPGEVVTREELRQKLWTGGIIVDFDHSLNTTINKLREALGRFGRHAAFHRDAAAPRLSLYLSGERCGRYKRQG